MPELHPDIDIGSIDTLQPSGGGTGGTVSGGNGYGSSGGYQTTTPIPDGDITKLDTVVTFDYYPKEIKIPLGFIHHKIILNNNNYDHFCRHINNSYITDIYKITDELGLTALNDGQYLFYPIKHSTYINIDDGSWENINSSDLGRISYFETKNYNYSEETIEVNLPTINASLTEGNTTNESGFDINQGKVDMSHYVKYNWNSARDKYFMVGANTFDIVKASINEHCLSE